MYQLTYLLESVYCTHYVFKPNNVSLLLTLDYEHEFTYRY